MTYLLQSTSFWKQRFCCVRYFQFRKHSAYSTFEMANSHFVEFPFISFLSLNLFRLRRFFNLGNSQNSEGNQVRYLTKLNNATFRNKLRRHVVVIKHARVSFLKSNLFLLTASCNRVEISQEHFLFTISGFMVDNTFIAKKTDVEAKWNIQNRSICKLNAESCQFFQGTIECP